MEIYMPRLEILILMTAILTPLLPAARADEPALEPTQQMTCNALKNLRRAHAKDPDALALIGHVIAAGTIGAGAGAAAVVYGPKGYKALKVLAARGSLLRRAQFHLLARRALMPALERTAIEGFERGGVGGMFKGGFVARLREKLPWLTEQTAHDLSYQLMEYFGAVSRDAERTTGPVAWTSARVRDLLRQAMRFGARASSPRGDVNWWIALNEYAASREAATAATRLKGPCGPKPPGAMGGALFGLGILADVTTTTRASAATPRDAVTDDPSLLFSAYAGRYGTSSGVDVCAPSHPELRALLTGTDENARLFRANVDLLGDASLAILHPELETQTAETPVCVADRASASEPLCNPSVQTCRDMGAPASPPLGREAH
jgi:hypothetical protein